MVNVEKMAVGAWIFMEILGCEAYTHAGIFHADDVFATVLLSKLFDSVQDFKKYLHRVNSLPDDEKVFAYDIGGGEYDHHQVDARVREDGVKYAAFGLLCEKLLPELYGEEVAAGLAQFVEDIDEQDNNGRLARTGEANPISILIKDFNPDWGEDQSPEARDAAFWRAVEFAEGIFDRKVKKIQGGIAARQEVQASETVGENVKGVILERFCPWQQNSSEDVAFAMFPGLRGGWNVSAKNSRVHPLPAAWLENKPKGCTFVHAGLFTSAFVDRESALAALRSVCE